MLSGNITAKTLPILSLFLALKPHTTELSIHTISLLVLSEPPIHSSNDSCPGGFTLLTEPGFSNSAVTFFPLTFLKKLFLFSKLSMCFFPLAWSVKADCPEVESYNALWKTLYQNLFFHFWPCLTKAFLNCGLSSQSSWSTFWWPLVTSCLLISCKENRLMKDRRQTHGFSPPRIKSRDLKILSGYHEGRNSDFHDNGACGFLVGYHLQWWNFL